MSFLNCEFCQKWILWINCVSHQVLCIKRNFTSSANALVIRWREFRITSGRPRRGRGGHSRLFSHCSDPFLGRKNSFLILTCWKAAFYSANKTQIQITRVVDTKRANFILIQPIFTIFKSTQSRSNSLVWVILISRKKTGKTQKNSSNRKCTFCLFPEF